MRDIAPCVGAWVVRPDQETARATYRKHIRTGIVGKDIALDNQGVARFRGGQYSPAIKDDLSAGRITRILNSDRTSRYCR